MIDGFHELFTGQFGRMVSLARLLGAADPEDLAQDAFVRIYAQWDAVRDPAAAPAYLRRIVINLCRNDVRKQRLRRSAATRDPVETASAEAAALARQDLAAVLAAVARLSRRRREALILRHWFGLPFQEIAATLGISPGGARSLVHRGVADLSRAAGPSFVREQA